MTAHIISTWYGIGQSFTLFATTATINAVTGQIMVEGVGRIQLQCKGLGGKRTLVINDVWYIPARKFNMISRGQLEDQGISLSLIPGGIGVGENGIVF